MSNIEKYRVIKSFRNYRRIINCDIFLGKIYCIEEKKKNYISMVEIVKNIIEKFAQPLSISSFWHPCPYGYINVCDLYEKLEEYRSSIINPAKLIESDDEEYYNFALIFEIALALSPLYYLFNFIQFDRKIPILTDIKNYLYKDDIQLCETLDRVTNILLKKSERELFMKRRQYFFLNQVFRMKIKLISKRKTSTCSITVHLKPVELSLKTLLLLNKRKGFHRMYMMAQLAKNVRPRKPVLPAKSSFIMDEKSGLPIVTKNMLVALNHTKLKHSMDKPKYYQLKCDRKFIKFKNRSMKRK